MKQVILTSNAPKAIGPYSQAIWAGGFLFCSGQIPLDPVSMQVVGSTAAEQAHQVLSNITALLAAAGSDLNQVVKTTIFLKNMSDFTVVNEVYAEFFKIDPPARSTVEVARLPKEVLVEIECIAMVC
ncbi:MAG: RidA family protein [Myxococcaceae bacterium]